MKEPAPASAKRVAVIAIHGVGDHPPREMARSIAGMLESRSRPNGVNRYEAFREKVLKVRIAPVQLHPGYEAPLESKSEWGPFDSLRLAKQTLEPSSKALQNSIDHAFMANQLSGYKAEGPEDSSEFLCLEGVRDAGAADEKLVHVYDMFWSDLSGVAAAGFRVFGELYQLLFHLGSIGVNNVAAAAAFFNGVKGAGEAWDRFTEKQKKAAGSLALGIPFLNLIILTVALTLFATAAITRLTPVEQSMGAALALIALFIGTLGSAVYRAMRKSRNAASSSRYRAPVAVALFLVVAVALVLIRLPALSTASVEIVQAVIALVVFVAILFGAFMLVRVYNRRRPGARSSFIRNLGAVGILSGVSLLLRPQSGPHFIALGILLRLAETGFIILTFHWAWFWITMLRAFFAGRAAVISVQRNTPGETDRAARTNWTARLTIALPATLFLLVTFPAWAGLLKVALPLLPMNPALDKHSNPTAWLVNSLCAEPDTLCHVPIIPSKPRGDEASNLLPARTWADNAFFDAGAGLVPLLLLLSAGALTIALYAVAPSVLTEVIDPPEGADPGKATALGNWLTMGYEFMRWSGRLLYLGIVLFPVAMLVVIAAIRFQAEWRLQPIVAAYLNSTAPFVESMGTLVGGAAIGLLAFGGRVSKIALGLRPVVRVALDVDNWLREHPRGTNPTARICARYVSLLRHVAQWRNANGEKYDALIIFAHSQGTVITADLLRFLHVERQADPDYDPCLQPLWRMTSHFFTVGCPLRQLYGQRFPYMYGYSEGTATAGPDPADLGIGAWTNAYRTGDYIGRFLWRSDGSWIPGDVFRASARAEAAIGPGAHTHYWDKTADEIADALDSVIAAL
jgi:hypothetical protein